MPFGGADTFLAGDLTERSVCHADVRIAITHDVECIEGIEAEAGCHSYSAYLAS